VPGTGQRGSFELGVAAAPGRKFCVRARNITTAVNARIAVGDALVKAYEMTTPNPSPGRDAHPSLATHAAMAAELEVELKADLGWQPPRRRELPARFSPGSRVPSRLSGLPW
jgi:hypothetical protein